MTTPTPERELPELLEDAADCLRWFYEQPTGDDPLGFQQKRAARLSLQLKSARAALASARPSEVAAAARKEPEKWILTVKRYAHDGGGLVVRCPHCKEVIGVDGEEGDDIRGEQFQHRSKRCDGWLEVWSQARRVAEV